MASLGRLVAVILFWGIIGITWAILNDQIVDKIPSMFPEPVTQDADNWAIMLFIWKISIIGLAIGSGTSILGQKSVSSVIGAGALLFAGMFTLIFIWASFWQVTNVTIPNSFASGFGTTTNEKSNLGIYDASFQIGMIGLLIISLIMSGSATLGRQRHNYRTIPKAQGKVRLVRREPEPKRGVSVYEAYQKGVIRRALKTRR